MPAAAACCLSVYSMPVGVLMPKFNSGRVQGVPQRAPSLPGKNSKVFYKLLYARSRGDLHTPGPCHVSNTVVFKSLTFFGASRLVCQTGLGQLPGLENTIPRLLCAVGGVEPYYLSKEKFHRRKIRGNGGMSYR